MMKFADLKVGQSESSKNKIESELIEQFAKISGDHNPVHLDDLAAEQSIFGKRIAHGMLISSFISAIIGNKLPGNGSIYLGQNLSFKLPVFIGDEITTTVTITRLRDDKKLVYLETNCLNQDDKIVIQGDAIIKFPH